MKHEKVLKKSFLMKKKLTLYSRNKLRNNKYYPGFFVTVGKKIL